MGATLIILGAIAFATVLIIVNEHLMGRKNTTATAKSDKLGRDSFPTGYPSNDGAVYYAARSSYEPTAKMKEYDSLRREVGQLRATLFLFMAVAVSLLFMFYMAS